MARETTQNVKASATAKQTSRDRIAASDHPRSKLRNVVNKKGTASPHPISKTGKTAKKLIGVKKCSSCKRNKVVPHPVQISKTEEGCSSARMPRSINVILPHPKNAIARHVYMSSVSDTARKCADMNITILYPLDIVSWFLLSRGSRIASFIFSSP